MPIIKRQNRQIKSTRKIIDKVPHRIGLFVLRLNPLIAGAVNGVPQVRVIYIKRGLHISPGYFALGLGQFHLSSVSPEERFCLFILSINFVQ